MSRRNWQKFRGVSEFCYCCTAAVLTGSACRASCEFYSWHSNQPDFTSLAASRRTTFCTSLRSCQRQKPFPRSPYAIQLSRVERSSAAMQQTWLDSSLFLIWVAARNWASAKFERRKKHTNTDKSASASSSVKRRFASVTLICATAVGSW